MTKGDRIGDQRQPQRVKRWTASGRPRAAAALALVGAMSCLGSVVPGALASASSAQAAASGTLYIGTTTGNFGRHPITLRIARGQVRGLTVYTNGGDPSTCGFSDLDPLPQQMSIGSRGFSGTRQTRNATVSVSGQLRRGSVSLTIVDDQGTFYGRACRIIHRATLRPWSSPSGAGTTPRAGGRYSGQTVQAYTVSFGVSKNAKSILRLRTALTMLCGRQQYGILIPGQASSSAPPMIASRISVGKTGGFAASLRYSGQTVLHAPAVLDGTLTISVSGHFVGRSHAAVGTLRASFAPSSSARQSGAGPCASPRVPFEAL